MSEKILVIDDDDTFLKMIELIFELNSYNALITNNGKQALEQLKVYKPDVIVLDLMMPGMNGFEVLEALKKNKDTKNIPVIIVSAVEDEESIDKVWKMGIADYIPKGAGLNSLMSSIRRTLNVADSHGGE
jgi:DNA-binding response OmpR family regulator